MYNIKTAITHCIPCRVLPRFTPSMSYVSHLDLLSIWGQFLFKVIDSGLRMKFHLHVGNPVLTILFIENTGSSSVYVQQRNHTLFNFIKYFSLLYLCFEFIFKKGYWPIKCSEDVYYVFDYESLIVLSLLFEYQVTLS